LALRFCCRLQVIASLWLQVGAALLLQVAGYRFALVAGLRFAFVCPYIPEKNVLNFELSNYPRIFVQIYA
jgi:hypothetical protein